MGVRIGVWAAPLLSFWPLTRLPLGRLALAIGVLVCVGIIVGGADGCGGGFGRGLGGGGLGGGGGLFGGCGGDIAIIVAIV